MYRASGIECTAIMPAHTKMNLFALAIDGDGVNALIARRVCYEAFRCEVYKYADGWWKNVFSTWIRSEFWLRANCKTASCANHGRCP
jgi:hypothetical protein